MMRPIPYGLPMRKCHHAPMFERWLLVLLLVPLWASAQSNGLVVLQTDFGLKDQAVAAMRGVIRSVDRNTVIDDLTHEIPAYDVWEASYRLAAVIDYWPSDAVFVSVVDPGVGTERKSVVARLRDGHTIVTPDNGTLTLVADRIGLAEVREIDEARHRLPGSEESFTFHGRDVYAYVGALLASGRLSFADVGPRQTSIVRLEYERAKRQDDSLIGSIAVLDPQYGNIWTNIPSSDLHKLGVKPGDRVTVRITESGTARATMTLPYANTFGDVGLGQPLLYVNSVGTLALAINQGDFATQFGVAAGPNWHVAITPVSGE